MFNWAKNITFCFLAFIGINFKVHPVLSEMVVCAVVSLHLYMLLYTQVQCYVPLWHLKFANFSHGICRIVKITIADSYPDMELWTQQTLLFSPSVLPRCSKMPIKTMSAASKMLLIHILHCVRLSVSHYTVWPVSHFPCLIQWMMVQWIIVLRIT